MHDNIREMETQIATFAYRYDLLLKETKFSVDYHAASLRISMDDITAMRTGEAMPELALVAAIAKNLWIDEGFLEGDSPYAC